MEPIVALLRPLFVPMLKLKLEPPHLPEGTALVRHLRPHARWLTFQYLRALVGVAGQFVGVCVVAVVLVVKLEAVGVLLALLLAVAEFGIIGFALVATRVDFELRHYLVGDRSLRVSMGAINHREVTLSYANIQNVEVRQGPMEQLFGFKNLTVSTAGSDAVTAEGAMDSHSVTLVGLEDADAVRKLVMDMLKHQKDTGLGSPDETHAPTLPIEELRAVRDAAVALRSVARTKS